MVVLRDGREALNYLFDETRDNAPLLMLLDLSLPELDGFQVLECVKTDERIQQIPIIIVSSVDEPYDVHRAYALGCSVYMTKPVRYDNLNL